MMKRTVEKLLCNECKKEVIGLWKDPYNQGQSTEQDYVHRGTLSSFCSSPEPFRHSDNGDEK